MAHCLHKLRTHLRHAHPNTQPIRRTNKGIDSQKYDILMIIKLNLNMAI